MAKLNKQIFKSKYRPKKVEQMALLPRIKKELYNEDGELIINNSYIFYGTPGIGKSTLARIITPEGAMKINSSIKTSVEHLRDTVMEYCQTGSIFSNDSINNFKIVYFDEFDRASPAYQDGLRTFMEEYEDRVIFIATVNNLSKITDAMKSRFSMINFDPQTEDEMKYLKNEYFDRCKAIKDIEGLNISDDQLKSLININFPDLRSVYNTLQSVKNVGSYNTTLNDGMNVDFYNIIFTKTPTEKIYDWVMSTFGDSVDTLIKMCGRPLSRYIIEERKEYINTLPALTKLFSEYSTKIRETSDPLVLVLSYIYEIKQTLKTI